MAETIVWVDADGTEHTLTRQSDVEVHYGVSGRFMPPMEHIDERVPLQPGARLRRVNVAPAEVELPVVFKGTTATALRSTVRAFARRFDPTRGDGKLRVTSHDGSQRELTCRYAEGLDTLVEDAREGLLRLRAILVFRAADPHWYDTATTTTTYTTGTTATFFPFFPLRLSSSEVFADATVDNAGDTESWPTWEVTGPGSNLVLRNLTTGKLLTLNVTLTAGQTVTIDTSPGVKTVTRDDGTNLYGSLADGSALWPLARGSNSLRVELTSATDDSQVQLSWRKRYWAA